MYVLNGFSRIKREFVLLVGILLPWCVLAQSSQGTRSESSSTSANPTSVDIKLPGHISFSGCSYEYTENEYVLVEFVNGGPDTLFDFTYHYVLDGQLAGPFTWQGSLPAWQTGSFQVGPFDFTQAGQYQITIYTEAPNQIPDADPATDTITVDYVIHPRPVLNNPMVDVITCSGTSVTLQADASFSQYEWSDNSSQSSIEAGSPGEYRVIMWDEQGCFVSDSVEVELYPVPSKILDADTSLCEGDPLVIEAEAGFTQYSWNTSEVGKHIAVDTSGTYRISVTDQYQCTHVDEIVVNFLDRPLVAMPRRLEVCEGDSVMLSAGTPSEQHWWSTGAQTNSIHVSQGGTYSVRVRNQNGCEVRDTTRVVLTPAALPDFGAVDSVLCNGEERVLSPGTFAMYDWSTGDSSSNLTVTQGGTYTVTVTNSYNCSGVTTVNLVDRQVEVDLGADTVICDGDAFVLGAGGYAYDSYLWDDGSSASTRVVVQGGSYAVEVSKYGSCTARDTVHIEQKFAPVSDFSYLVQSASVDFTNTSTPGFESLIWDFGDGSTATTDQVTYTYGTLGVYEVSLTVENVCGTSVKRQEVSVLSLEVRELFNADHIRVYPNPATDLLQIELSGFEGRELDLLLYNDLGQLLHARSLSLSATLAWETLDVSRFAKGTYFLQFAGEEEAYWHKVIVY